MEKLRAEEAAAKAAADREAARLAALKLQQEREAALTKAIAELKAELETRIIYATDFKRRPHYNKTVEMSNDEILARVAQLNAELEALQAAGPAATP